MLIVDLNQVLISNLMQQIGSNPKIKLDEDLIRHMVLTSLKSYVKQFKQSYGDVVIACDSKKYWRREAFPLYKANRKKDREASEFDWPLIFDTFNKIRDELKENFPYKVIEVEGAEADDIIGILAKTYHDNEQVLILSSDKDFVQLQKYPNVTQYSPILKKFIKTDDPQQYVREHIIKGDRGDGIPNLLSADNVFVIGERQKSINSVKLQEWVTKDPEEFCNDNMLRNYKRNQQLIDFDYIPQQITENVLHAFKTTTKGSKQKMLTYCIEKGLKNLIENLDEF